jgi:hypothetical protein
MFNTSEVLLKQIQGHEHSLQQAAKPVFFTASCCSLLEQAVIYAS